MRPSIQPEACGRCHSRRAPVAAAYKYGKTLLDTHLPAFLEEGLYFADGQILDEVYVYGSFLQSRMYRAGVTCTDCHDPHSAMLRTAGPASSVCASCHLAATFSNVEHQRHAPDTVECVDCHMASRTYMGVDARRDHSFRVPRPDLTIATGSPNACNACHADKDAQWAEAAIREWFGGRPRPHFATAIHAGRSGAPSANRLLLEVIGDDTVPGIARATAMTLLAAPYDEAEQNALQHVTTSADAMLRLAALRAIDDFPVAIRAQLAGPLLADPILGVRFEAMRVLTASRNDLPQRERLLMQRVEREYVESQLAIADRPEALANLANLSRDAGNHGKAEDYYRLALSRAPAVIVARVNLADSYAQQERHAEAEQLLREGLEIDTGNATLHHALGLALARMQHYDEALAELQAAVTLDADNSRFVYVYAIALNSLGRSDEALSVLIEARERFPGDFDIAWTQVTMSRDRGRLAEAKHEAARLRAQFPQNAEVRTLQQSLDGGH
jgi:tetratricopeptide (TPR) repeat protein